MTNFDIQKKEKTMEEIIEKLELNLRLLELHDENEFKIKSLSFAIRTLDEYPENWIDFSTEKLASIKGIGKSVAAKIESIKNTGNVAEILDLLEKTPTGLLDIFRIKGLGSKKIKMLWKEANITNIEQLQNQAKAGNIANIKGFGEKMQQSILEAIAYLKDNECKSKINHAKAIAEIIYDYLKSNFPNSKLLITGDVRQCNEIVNTIQLVVTHPKAWELFQVINTMEGLEMDRKKSSPFAWRGFFSNSKTPIEILVCNEKNFTGQCFINSASNTHLQEYDLLKIAQNGDFENEEEIYKSVNLPYIIPEMRNGKSEFEWSKNHKTEALITWQALKGSVHNHSTYSDGKHSLKEMADGCKKLGFEYFGIADHSKTAFYANGLSEERIAIQHKEIEQLNLIYAQDNLHTFKILKGIESDILADGSLDYADEILKTFDYAVASVHQNLTMKLDKSMPRLIKAIENQYTTILGHPTGRLLLSREGYEVDHKKIIDACAANGVVIELNASPYRLDIDWRWIPYCLEKNVKIAINPDAHHLDGFMDMHYGVGAARKGGLITEMTFNALSLKEIESFLKAKHG